MAILSAIGPLNRGRPHEKGPSRATGRVLLQALFVNAARKPNRSYPSHVPPRSWRKAAVSDRVGGGGRARSRPHHRHGLSPAGSKCNREPWAGCRNARPPRGLTRTGFRNRSDSANNRALYRRGFRSCTDRRRFYSAASACGSARRGRGASTTTVSNSAFRLLLITGSAGTS